MALTKAQVKEILSSAGVTAENMDAAVDRIMDGHLTSINALREERDGFKADAEKLPNVQKELDDMKKAASKDGKDPWKVKYDALKEEFTDYKKDIEAKETTAKKSDAFRALLKEVGIREKRIDAVLRVSDLDSIELDENGAIVDAGKLKKSIAEEWEDFIDTTEQKGVQTVNPPTGKGKGKTMSKDEIMAIRDPVQRQNAIAENLDLFT